MLRFQIFINSIMSENIKKLTFLLLIGVIIPQAYSTCGSYCYSQPSIYGDCKICYNQCSNTDQVSFKSCSITPGQSSQTRVLSETLCKLRCYPEQYKNLIVQAVQIPIEGPVGKTVNEKQVQPQIPATFEELQRLKKETQNWTPPEQNILKIIGVLVLCSLTFIAAFTQVWRCIDMKRKLNELQQKPRKEWAKQFSKVQQNETTFCPSKNSENKALSDE